MPLLTAARRKSKKRALNVFMEEELFAEVKAYCTWASMNRPTEFIIQAIHYVLKNDKEWRKAIQLGQQNLENLPGDKV